MSSSVTTIVDVSLQTKVVVCYTLYMNKEFFFLNKEDAFNAMRIAVEHNCPFHYMERYMHRDGKYHAKILAEQSTMTEKVLAE